MIFVHIDKHNIMDDKNKTCVLHMCICFLIFIFKINDQTLLLITRFTDYNFF